MSGLEELVIMAAQAYILVILAAVACHWLGVDPANKVVELLNRLTAPVFGAIRRVVSTYVPALDTLGFDLTPVWAIILVHFTKRVLLFIL
jgi:YggT family protein